MNMSISWPTALTGLRALVAALAVAAAGWRILLSTTLAIPSPKRPALSLLERWYAASFKRRRVVAVIPNWTLDALSTRSLLSRKVKQFALMGCLVREGRWQHQHPQDSFPGRENKETAGATIPLEVITDTGGEEDGWKSVAERLLSENMCDESVLWRAAICEKERFLIIMVDHVLTDGLGLAGLVKAIVDDAREESGGFPPALEDHVDVRTDLRRLVRAVKGDSASEGLFVGPLPLDYRPNAETQDGTILGFTTVPGKTMQRLRVVTREHEVTIHSLICSCACVALASTRHSNESAVLHPLRFKVLVPISLRKRVPNMIDQPFGNYVAPSSVIADVSSAHKESALQKVWRLSKDVHRNLRKDMEGAERELGLLALISDLAEYRRKKEFESTLARTAAIEVSNLGECDTSRPWFFAQGNHYIGPLLAVNVVTNMATKDMYVTVTARSLAVSRSSLDRFAHELKELLLQCSTES